MPPSFQGSPAFTLGVEWEATVVDGARLMPSAHAAALAAGVPALEHGQVTVDAFASTLEIVTGVCSSIEDVRRDLTRAWRAIAPQLEREQVALLAAGLHPVARPADFTLSAHPRAGQLTEHLRHPFRVLTTTGLHVHVGMPDGATALRAVAALRRGLPMLLGLAAASPFAEGDDTGLASARMSRFTAVPRSGLMPQVETWQEWQELAAAMQRADPLDGSRDMWWDVRLQPVLGTVEIRVMDSMPDLERLLACVTAAWCMAVDGVSAMDAPLPLPLADENRWRAIRDGLDATLVDLQGAMPLRELAAERLDGLRAIAARLGCEAELASARALLDQPTLADHWRRSADDVGVAGTAAQMLVDW